MTGTAYNLDLTVLRLLRDRSKFERFHGMIPAGTVNKETASLLKSFKAFFDTTDAARITHAEFWPFLRSRYPKWKDKDVAFWQALTAPIDRDNPPGLEDQILRNLLATDLGRKALDSVEKWQAGEEIDLAESLRGAVDSYDAAVERKVRATSIELGWADMIEEETNQTGLRWRLECLNASTRPLRAGDAGIIAMRPDRGKTTMVASEVTFMAPQLADLHPGEFRPILWMNNEGPGRRIVSRLRQAALGMSLSEIVALGDKAQRAYIEAIGGREDLIQVVDIHGWHNYEVEELIRKKRPGLCVLDMVDNVRFIGEAHNGSERQDSILERMYDWYRGLGVRYEFVALSTSQISGDGDGMRFPTQTMLKDSKTGKQGACDFIVMGGFDPAMPSTRFISMPKNKIKREGGRSSPDAQVLFDADRARLTMPTMED